MKIPFFLICLCLLIVRNINALDANATIINKFPLWNTTWVIAEGENRRIFPSVSPLVPQKIVLLQFNSDQSILIEWANLKSKDYPSTADVLEDIKKQFSQNKTTIDVTSSAYFTHDSLITFSYVDLTEIQYACENDMKSYEGVYNHFYRTIGAKTIEYDPFQTYSSVWDKTSTVIVGRRNRLTEDNLVYPYEDSKSGFRFLTMASMSQDNPNYCDSFYCYEKIKCTEKKFVIKGYWQIHVFPEVFFYPRDPFSGNAIKSESLTKRQAFDKKKESINNPDDIKLKYYRDPVLSDSLSTIVSFGFANDTGLKNQDYIWLSSAEAGSQAMYNHYPNRMYRIKNETMALDKALLSLYTTDDEERTQMRSLNDRCIDWKNIDKANGQILYKKVGNVLVRDTSVDNSIFSYNDCPCSRITSLNNFTAAQLRRFTYAAMPVCSISDMKLALYLYKEFLNYLTASDDQAFLQQRIIVMGAMVDKRIAILKAKSEKENITLDSLLTAENNYCTDTWVKIFK